MDDLITEFRDGGCFPALTPLELPSSMSEVAPGDCLCELVGGSVPPPLSISVPYRRDRSVK
ncbi:hypothetical protein [Actinomadura rubteroloni]|uniref:hypothetical protein n=1 Tax=Actinomadura rubteroloni TaxID=1926885 RepID=UPI00143D51FE|nr:hypothetical protein [Actinomadura rubteroloni]